MLFLAILFIITSIYLIYANYKTEHFSTNLPTDIHNFNRNLIKFAKSEDTTTNENLFALNITYELI